MKLRISWRAKLADSKDFPKVERITDKMSTRWGTGTIVIPLEDEGHTVVTRGKRLFVQNYESRLARL